MSLTGIDFKADGVHQTETFYCAKCGKVESRDVVKDPLTKAAGWLKGELRPPK